MPKYIFYTQCPICCDGKARYWRHQIDKGDMLISEDCDLECEECHLNDFIINWYFGCSDHEGYQKPDSFDVVDALCGIGGMPGVDKNVRMRMKKSLREKLNLK